MFREAISRFVPTPLSRLNQCAMSISTRRQFLLQTLPPLLLPTISRPSPATANGLSSQPSTDDPISIGIITDTHIGLAEDAAWRLRMFLQQMGQQKPQAILQMGDFAYPQAEHQKLFDAFNELGPQPLHVIGNHDYDHNLTAQDCLERWDMPARYYNQALGAINVIVLDGNEKGSPSGRGGYPAYIGLEQQAWLEEQLQQTTSPVLIVSHQPLAGQAELDNASEMRQLLAKYSEKILLCLNGHSHVDQLLIDQRVTYLHINSASYYWLGGKERWAAYTDPLFATLTIDLAAKQILIKGTRSSWKTNAPEQIGYFEKREPKLRQIVTPQILTRCLARHTG